MSRALLLGGAGFVGRALNAYLIGREWHTEVMDVARSRDEDARIHSLPIHGIDTVFFLAWDVGGAKYLESKPAQLAQLEHNTALMQKVFPQLKGVRSVFVSSQLAEEDSVYGHTKRLGELWAEELGIPVIRLWNVYGAYEPISLRSHVVADIIWQALTKSNKCIDLLTDGEESRQFVYIDDVCRDILTAAELGGYDSVDSTTKEWDSVLSVARTVADMTGCKVSVSKEKGRRQSPTPGRRRIGESYISLDEGLAKTISFYRSLK